MTAQDDPAQTPAAQGGGGRRGNQITRDNVQELKLAWEWAMNDSGTSETSPIVHNGILYLLSPSHIVQALDAKTGDLIWESHAGPYQAPGGSGSPMRSSGISQDKILIPANNGTRGGGKRPERGDSLGYAAVNLSPRITSESFDAERPHRVADAQQRDAMIHDRAREMRLIRPGNQ